MAVYYLTPYRHRWLPMLIGSYVFYMCCNPAYILLIMASTAVDYVVAQRLGNEEREPSRRRLLAISLFFNLGLLFVFKYFGFFAENVNQLFEYMNWQTRITANKFVLPVGISFYTFQTLSYTIDVYRRKLEPETHLGRFALYVSFFPQLVAGPIERAVNLLPELKKKVDIDPDQIAVGLKLILWGLFKKMVIADRLADYVNRIYGDVDGQTGTTLLIATYFFAFQIYCDFSGYSDIAIGSARMFGIRLMQNFRLPYLAKGISDFWSRWHISLTTWFRDYLYFPLGGNRVSVARWMVNIAAVFLISGLWHGAQWTYVIWGAIHAGLYFVERLLQPLRDKCNQMKGVGLFLFRAVSMFLTFHAVVVAWVFFRAESLTDGLTIIKKFAMDVPSKLYIGSSSVEFGLSVLLIFLLISVQFLQHFKLAPFYQSRGKWHWLWVWIGSLLVALAILLLGKSNNDFIYFQF